MGGDGVGLVGGGVVRAREEGVVRGDFGEVHILAVAEGGVVVAGLRVGGHGGWGGLGSCGVGSGRGAKQQEGGWRGGDEDQGVRRSRIGGEGGI